MQERDRTTGIINLKGGFCGPRNVDALRPRRIHTRGMSVEVATPGPFNDEENKNARLSCVLLVLRYHCAGASIGASQGEYSVKLLGTGLLAVSFSKEKETARRPTVQIFNIVFDHACRSYFAQ